MTSSEGGDRRLGLDFTVVPEPARLQDTRETVREHVARYCSDQSIVSDVVLAIEEACSNAMRHSGTSDPIDVSLCFDDQGLRISVRDHGHGFDVEAFDPDRVPEAAADSGRGLFLISRLCDEMELCCNGGGTEVRFFKRVPGAAPAASDGAATGGLAAAAASPPVAAACDDPAQRLVDLERHLTDVLGLMTEAFVSVDRDWRYTAVNRRAEQIIGRPADDLLGRSMEELFPDMLGWPHYRAVMDEREARSFEVWAKPIECWLEVHARPTAAGLSIVFTDISSRKSTESSLREAVQSVRTDRQRFRALFDAMAEGVALHELVYADGRVVDYRIVDVNPAYERQTGVAADSARGALASELYGTGEAPYLEVYARVAETGEPAWFESDFAPLGRRFRISVVRPEPGSFATVFEDITGQTKTQAALEAGRRRAELLAWTASSLLATDDPQGLVEELCARVMVELDCQAFFNFLVDPAAGRLHLNACGGIPEEEARRIEWLDYGVAVCGCAARDACRIVAEDIATTHDPRTDLVASYGITAYAAHPLMIEGHVLGTLSFGTRTRSRFLADDLALMKTVADHVAIAIAHKQADEERRHLLAVSQRQTETLQTQSAELHARADELHRRDRLNTALTGIDVLIHSTLRADEIMRRVVAAATEAVGCDSVMVALRRGDDWVAEYGYPEVPGVIHESVRGDEAPFMMTAVEERRPVAIDDCEHDPRCIPEVQHRFGVRSVMCLPLLGRDEPLGVIFFNHHRAAVPFDGPTVDFAGKLALAISLALENARLYEEQQRIATTLQANFIHRLPEVVGVELGEVSQSAFEPELIGGDFSDAFELPDDRIAILIGDVAGKGVRAAGLTETVRSSVRAFATIDAAPPFVLRKTSEALLRYAPAEPHVTAFFGVLEQRSGLLLGASAGHPAPIHLSPASCRQLDMAYGPPLGTFAYDYATTRATLTSDDSLVLYTDGALEARRGTEQFGEARLLEAVAALRGAPAQELADGVLAAVVGFAGRLRDDLQVVTLRLG